MQGDPADLVTFERTTLKGETIQLPDGRLIGLTKRGWFHIHRLRLNRSQLITLRQQREVEQRLRQTLENNRQAYASLLTYVRELEQEVVTLLQIITRLIQE